MAPIYDSLLARSSHTARSRCHGEPTKRHIPCGSPRASLEDLGPHQLLATNDQASCRPRSHHGHISKKYLLFYELPPRALPTSALRPHCPICQSRAHTMEQCEYNMLNNTTATSVRHMESHHDRPRRDDRNRLPPRFQEIERPRYDDRYRPREDRYRPTEDSYRYDYDWDEDYEPRYRDDQRQERRHPQNNRGYNNRQSGNNRRPSDNRRQEPQRQDHRRPFPPTEPREDPHLTPHYSTAPRGTTE